MQNHKQPKPEITRGNIPDIMHRHQNNTLAIID